MEQLIGDTRCPACGAYRANIAEECWRCIREADAERRRQGQAPIIKPDAEWRPADR